MKILASDYDGTLRRNEKVAFEDINSIKLWQESGNLFGIVTGRHTVSILGEIHNNNIPFDFIISAAGAVILDKNENYIFEKQVKKKTVLPLYEITRKMRGKYFCASLFNERIWYGTGKLKSFRGNSFQNPESVSEITSFHEVGTRFGTELQARRYIKKVLEQLGNEVNPQQNGKCVDISAKSTCKVDTLYRLLDIYSAKKEDLITVGDSHNDIEMVTEFNGYAIKSGKRALLKAATKSAEGIAEIIADNL